MARNILACYLFTMLILPHSLIAASCCGQSSAGIPLLSLGQKYFLSLSLSKTQALGRVFNDGSFLVWEDQQRRQDIWQIGLGTSLSDLSQVFLQTRYHQNHFQDAFGDAQSTDFGDTNLSYLYEVLPEYEYSPWRPSLYLGTSLAFPTGRSIHAGDLLGEGAGVTGFDQWGLGLNFSARKWLYPLEVLVQYSYMYLWGRNFGSIQVSSSISQQLQMQVLWQSNWWNLQWGLGIQHQSLGPRKLSSANSSTATSEFTSLQLSLIRSFTERHAVSLNFTDDGWLGPARNSLIQQSFTLNWSQNFF